MRKPSRRLLVRAALVALVVAGVLGATLGLERVALGATVLLAGLCAWQSTRVLDRVTAGRRQIEQIGRLAKRASDVAVGNRRRLRRLEDRSKDLKLRSVALHRAVDEFERRSISVLESERVRAADRHRALLAAVPSATEGGALTPEMDALKAQAAAARGHLPPSTRNSADVVDDAPSRIETVLHALQRLSPRLLPPQGSWPLDARRVAHLVDIVVTERPQTIVEVGSGPSTVYLGHLAESADAKVISVEHDAESLAQTEAEVAEHELSDVVELRHVPLTDQENAGAEVRWDDRGALTDLDVVDLLVVDAPSEAVGARSSQHAVSALIGKLRSGALVILDDSQRPGEQAIVKRWAESSGLMLEDHGISRFTVLRVP